MQAGAVSRMEVDLFDSDAGPPPSSKMSWASLGLTSWSLTSSSKRSSAYGRIGSWQSIQPSTSMRGSAGKLRGRRPWRRAKLYEGEKGPPGYRFPGLFCANEG